jgi:hypothetical protein
MSLLTLLFVVWAAITLAFVCVWAWKSVLGTREEDVVFLSEGEAGRLTEQKEIIDKEVKLLLWAKITGFSSAGLLLLLLVLWGYRAFQGVLPT